MILPREPEDKDSKTSKLSGASPFPPKSRKVLPFNKNQLSEKAVANPSSILYPDILEQDGYIGIMVGKDEDKRFERIGRAIYLESIYHNIENDEITYRLTFDYLDRTINTELPRSGLTKTKILQLAEQGADVFEHNSIFVIKWLHNQEQKLRTKVTHVHHDIGWAEIQDQLVYKANRAVGFDSEYQGQLTIAPKGSFEGWKTIIETYVLGCTPLESMLVFGLSAIVVGLIAKNTGIDTPIVHIYSESSSGKSTATKLAISSFGYPGLKEDGLYGTWNTTKNASVSSLRGNNGMAVAFDELSLSDQNDLSGMVYSLASGKDKVRMLKDDHIRKTGRWNTAILSNGEHSLTVKTNQNTGLKVRKLEFGNVTWTESAEQADAISLGILNHYGHAAPVMARSLIELGKDQVIIQWKTWIEKVLSAMPNKDHFSDRIAAKIAVMMVTADLAKKALSLSLNLDEILNFILQHEQQDMEDRDISSKAYQYLLEQVNINEHKFVRTYDNGVQSTFPSGETWGKIENKTGTRRQMKKKILLFPQIFNKLMAEGGFQDPKIILKEWKKRDILDCEKDRFTRNRSVITDPVNVYVICVQEAVDDEDQRRGKERTVSSIDEME